MGLALGSQLSVYLVAHEAVFVHPLEPLSGYGRAWACVLACSRVGISVCPQQHLPLSMAVGGVGQIRMRGASP